MPKAEKGSLKDLGKRMKSKGLQKLKYYCQMCEKQCRDANGFKCHLTSDSHLRQMKIFSDHSTSYVNSYSKEFEKTFLDHLRMRHSTARVNANNVYQEIIHDKQHIHMNSTMWSSLSDFCKYLGKIGKCHVEETERGWYISYINVDVNKLQIEEAQKRKQALEQEAEVALQQQLDKQRIEAAKAMDRVGQGGGEGEGGPTRLQRDAVSGGDNAVKLSLSGHNNKDQNSKESNKKKKIRLKAIKNAFGGDDDDDSDDDDNDGDDKNNNILHDPNNAAVAFSSVVDKKSKSSNRSRVVAENKALPKEKKKRSRSDENHEKKKKAKNGQSSDGHAAPPAQEEQQQPWLYRDIMVRIINKHVGDGKYYRCKATIDKIVDDDGYTAEVTVVGSSTNSSDSIIGDVLRLDQDDLETVAPKQQDSSKKNQQQQQKVRIVKGPYRGKKARALVLDKKRYTAKLELLKSDGTVLENVDYDDFSLLA